MKHIIAVAFLFCLPACDPPTPPPCCTGGTKNTETEGEECVKPTPDNPGACVKNTEPAAPLNPRVVPIPTGTNEAALDDMRDAVFAMDACLVSQAALPAKAALTIDVLEAADGDDQQAFRVALTSHAHEDSVDCMREVVIAWKEGL